MSATITPNAMTLLKARYLSGGESVDGLWDRVSGGNETFRNLMANLRFLPNSPTLFNAGLNNGCTLSACFVFDIQDSMFGKGSITETRNKAVAVAKAGGGVGYYGGLLRPKGSLIKSIHKKACGPVVVLKDYQAISRLITQGGKRELAQMFVLPVSHEDIREFIHVKDEDPQGLGSFNISVSWGTEDVGGPGGVSSFSKNPSDPRGNDQLWWEQCHSAWKHGCPGMFFPDTVNRSNPNKHLGLMRAPNPCGETPNRSDEPCNLGSLVLTNYFTPHNRGIDWNLLEEDAWNATLFLDDVLDRNTFPHPDITQAALLTRKLGLGVMGWADLLAMCHIHYDTEEAVTLGGKVMKLIQEVSHACSEQLAREKGPYKGYSDRTEAPMRRNETTTSIAPTGSIAIIGGVAKSQSIEPHYDDVEIERTTAEGIKMLERMDTDLFEGFKPKTAHQIPYEWHIRHQAEFQKYTDLGVSKTINLPNSATIEDVSKAYHMMYEMGCKGGTVYRDGSRSEQVLVTQKTKSVYSLPDQASSPTPLPRKRKVPRPCNGFIHAFRIGNDKFYLTGGMYDDGTLGEIFLNPGQGMGSTMDGMLDAFSKTFSSALQHGMPLAELVRLHKGTRFEPCGLTKDPDVPNCTSIADFVVRWLGRRFLGAKTTGKPVTPPEGECSKETLPDSGTGMYCPQCNTEAIYQGGCLTCPDSTCGWSRCG